jgi:DNA-binding MarR family transcriptional regulator
VNCSTTRCTTPAAAPRTGRGESALPHPDPGTKTQPPFAAIPHDIAADPHLSPTDLRVLAALLYYARQDPSCYPSDASIAARVHRHPGTVRRCLKRLEDLGYIRREFVQATPANPTGRLIHLTCTEPDWPRPEMVPTPERRCTPTPERQCTPTPERQCTPTPERQRTPTPCADEHTPRAPAHTNREDPEEEERNVTIFPSIRKHEQPLSYRTDLPVRTPGPEAAAPCPQQSPTDGPTTPQVASSCTTPPTGPATPPGPPRPLKDEFRTLPGAAPDRVRALAWRLAHHLRDTASVGFFVMVLSLVAAGSAPVERLMAAYVAADRSRGKAQKPGAIFVSVWSGWQPPLRPSEINRPFYYQAGRGCDPVISSPAPPPGGDELSREEEIMTLRDILSRPHGPFARVARARLAELGAAPDPI